MLHRLHHIQNAHVRRYLWNWLSDVQKYLSFGEGFASEPSLGVLPLDTAGDPSPGPVVPSTPLFVQWTNYHRTRRRFSDRFDGVLLLSVLMRRLSRFHRSVVFCCSVTVGGSYTDQQLEGFMLVAVPLNAQDETTAMGTFQVVNWSFSRISLFSANLLYCHLLHSAFALGVILFTTFLFIVVQLPFFRFSTPMTRHQWEIKEHRWSSSVWGRVS